MFHGKRGRDRRRAERWRATDPGRQGILHAIPATPRASISAALTLQLAQVRFRFAPPVA